MIPFVDTIKTYANIIISIVIAIGCFTVGWTLARYIDARAAEKVATAALEEKLAIDKVTISAQVAIMEADIKDAAQKQKSLEENQNANTIIDNLMRDADKRSGVRVVSVKGICASPVPESNTPASAVSPASTVFEQYDAGLADVRRASIEAVRACEVDRESVIRQAGGR